MPAPHPGKWHVSSPTDLPAQPCPARVVGHPPRARPKPPLPVPGAGIPPIPALLQAAGVPFQTVAALLPYLAPAAGLGFGPGQANVPAFTPRVCAGPLGCTGPGEGGTGRQSKKKQPGDNFGSLYKFFPGLLLPTK